MSAGSDAETPQILVIGDSTTTDKGGSGLYWMPSLINAIGRRVGNIPGLRWLVPANDYSYLCRSACTNGGTPRYLYTNGATNQMVPGFGSSAGGLGKAAAAEGWNQFAVVAQTDGHNVMQPWGYTQSGLFPVTGLNLEIMAAAATGSSEATVISCPHHTRYSANYSASTLATYATTMGINAAPPAGHLLIKKQTLGPFNQNGAEIYPQAHIYATTEGARFDAIAARWRNPNPKGFLIDSLAAGGYRGLSWFGTPNNEVASFNHGDCRDLLAALKPDIVIYMMGGNDAYVTGGPISAANYKLEMWNPSGTKNNANGVDTYGLVGETMRAFRSGGADPIPIFVPCVFRPDDGTGATYATKKAEHRLYSQVLYDLAQEWNGFFWGLHRILYEAGWNETGEDWVSLTNKNTWASSTAYAVGDMVMSPLDSSYWRCAVAHTSSADNTNRPGFGVGEGTAWINYWRPIRQFSTSDYAHWTRMGSLWIAEAMAQCLFDSVPNDVLVRNRYLNRR